MFLNDYIITKYIDNIDKMKANEKFCIKCNRYSPHVIKGLCIIHYTKQKWITLKKKRAKIK